MARPVASVEVTADSLHPTVTRLAGWAFLSASDVTCIELREGAVDGPLLGVIGIASRGSSDALAVPPGSIVCEDGVWVKVLAGSIASGVLYTG